MHGGGIGSMGRAGGPIELTLDGFEDDVQGQAEATDWAGGLTDAAFETGSGVGEGGFHLPKVDASLGDEGEGVVLAAALGQERDEMPLAGGVEDLFVGE